MRRSRSAAVLIFVVALVAAGCGDDDAGQPGTATTTSPPTTTGNSTTISPPSSTAAPAPSTSAQPKAPTEAPTPEAGPGGGSGEIAVRWRAVAGATGYRVQRADAPNGTFEVSADIDVVSGQTTLGEGVTNLWSPGPDEFEYIEVVSGGTSARYFRIMAYNDAGDGPVSAVVCGAPTTGTSSC